MDPPAPETAPAIERLTAGLRERVLRARREAAGLPPGPLRDAQILDLRTAASLMYWSNLETAEARLTRESERTEDLRTLRTLIVDVRMEVSRAASLAQRFAALEELMRRAEAESRRSAKLPEWRIGQ
jgi:hypothetical protein